jgi:hypothetical protein
MAPRLAKPPANENKNATGVKHLIEYQYRDTFIGKMTMRIYCNQCLNVTNHTVEGTYKSRWDEEEVGVDAGATHELLKCCGCEQPTLRSQSWCSENQEGPTYSFHPPRKDCEERKPKQFSSIRFGTPLDSVYRQAVSAFSQQLLTLAGAGVRLVIEGVCKERQIRDGGLYDDKGILRTTKAGKPLRSSKLEGKINALAELELISKTQAATLHQIRFLGNDSAHELYQPTLEELNVALDIVEHLLEQVYEQPTKSKLLALRKRPGREN